MGARYLTDLADVLRAVGLTVTEVDGWQQIARGSGGYDGAKPDHVMIHHTASGRGSDGWPDVNYCTFNDDDAPLCNLYLGRTGEVWVCAAGATNTNGSGDCGHLSPDTMNSSAIGIEAGNDGVGEAWPPAQTTAYVVLVSALCAAYGIAVDHVHSHQEWAPTRKTDPAGPSPWTSSGTWPMDAFRADLGATPGPMPPTPHPPPDEEDDMTTPTWLVVHPRTGEYLTTDLATYTTYVPSSDVAGDGRDRFGWKASPDGGPFSLGAEWADYLDQLPRTSR